MPEPQNVIRNKEQFISMKLYKWYLIDNDIFSMKIPGGHLYKYENHNIIFVKGVTFAIEDN